MIIGTSPAIRRNQKYPFFSSSTYRNQLIGSNWHRGARGLLVTLRYFHNPSRGFLVTDQCNDCTAIGDKLSLITVPQYQKYHQRTSMTRILWMVQCYQSSLFKLMRTRFLDSKENPKCKNIFALQHHSIL